MFHRLSTFFVVCALAVAGLVSMPQPVQASLAAGKAFAALKGNTTIDRGGAIHSQTRSIYSLGGGMTTFTGKRVTFLAVDPPSYSAGCSGISWHFGGFAFISMAELQELVQAISQAALGLAIDLAIQTLCPQCYAVMSKLRDIANTMRNAAADSCKTAKMLVRTIGHQLGASSARQTECAETTSEEGKSSSWLESASGNLCNKLSKVNSFLDDAGNKLNKFLNGDYAGGDGSTPTKSKVDKHFNVQYEMLTALGFRDGVVKDLMLNFAGMTIYDSTVSSRACEAVSVNLSGFSSPGSDAASALTATRPGAVDPKTKEQTLQEVTLSKPPKTGADKGPNTCHLPPRLTGVEEMAIRMVCGFDPARDAKIFAQRFGHSASQVRNSSIGTLCSINVTDDGGKPSISSSSLSALSGNPKLYTCDRKDTAACTRPREISYNDLIGSSEQQYTGLAWLVADALFMGVYAVETNQNMPETTKQILNGSGYPLYRLINMAAVYPGLANELLSAYASTIAVEYVVNVLDKLGRPGSFVDTSLKDINSNIDHKDLMAFRDTLTNMFDAGGTFTDRTLARLSKKNALIQSIINVNRALQADVISQGLSGNESFALSLKKQIEDSSSSHNP